MKLPVLDSINVKGKRVLLRLDLDVSVERGKVEEDMRLQVTIPTIRYLLEHEAGKIIILGHRGRPSGFDANLSLEPVAKHLEKLLLKEMGKGKMANLDMFVMENLRFNPGESLDFTRDKDAQDFAKELAEQGDIYVNDAFASCHEEHVSIVGLPKLLPYAAGLHLIEEVKNLSKVLDDPKKPVVFVIGGGKMDKVVLVEKLLDHAEWVLVGGVLPKKIKSYCREKDGRMCIVAAHLTPNGEDITPDSVRNFAEIIRGAGTVIWNGPMGDIDKDIDKQSLSLRDKGYWEGTEIIAEAVVTSNAFKVVGGGDTIRALKQLRLLGEMNYVSTGGGAMLEFLAYGDLPGLAALRYR